MKKICEVTGCSKPVHSTHYCAMHHSRIQRWGSAEISHRHFWSSSVAKRLFHLAKARAKKHGFEFALSPADIIIPSHCPILGIPLQAGEKIWTDHSPSLDRIDTAKGYVRDNVQIISCLANRIKTNATPEQILAVGLYLTGSKQAYAK
jgi:hypothetical protein